MAEIPIKNADWWLPHSQVILKGPYLAKDDGILGTLAQGREGEAGVLKVRHMVKTGTVAVLLSGGVQHEVALPAGVDELTTDDLIYILNQIAAVSRPMTAQERDDFLASASASTQGS